ncbi:MAG: hypothetical protein ACQEWV_03455 [Bacillota bacterium]
MKNEIAFGNGREGIDVALRIGTAFGRPKATVKENSLKKPMIVEIRGDDSCEGYSGSRGKKDEFL